MPTNNTSPSPLLDDLSRQVLRHWLKSTGWRLFSVAIGRKSDWYGEWGFPNEAGQSLPEEVAYDLSGHDARHRRRGDVLTWFLDAMESLAPVVGFDLDSAKFDVSRNVAPSAGTYREGIAVLRAALADAGFGASGDPEGGAKPVTPTRLERAGSSDE